MQEKTRDGLVDEIFKGLKCTEEITVEFIKVTLSDISLFDRKQHDYGSANISEFGEYGVLVRSNDKIARLKNLLRRDNAKNESVEDSWRDLSIYGIIARLCRSGKWK